MGAWLSVDDFGTGRSTLDYLKQLPVDELKVDRSFVMDMAANPENAFTVQAVIDLAHGLDHTVVAEGVENETANMVESMGCDIAQGISSARRSPVTP